MICGVDVEMDIEPNRYQLRYAAGRYWLLDMKPSGESYPYPRILNRTGAQIWKLIESGCTRREAAEQLADEYSLPVDEVEKDISDFITMISPEEGQQV